MKTVVFSKPTKPVKPVKKLQFEIQKTSRGKWKIHRDKKGKLYKEYTSNIELFDFPLVSIVSGVHPKTKKQGLARGIIAIGPKASGVIAVGQFCQGYIAIGQFAVGRLFAVGQFALAPLTIGQVSLAAIGLGQIGIAGLGAFQVGVTLFAGVGQALLDLGHLW